MAEINLAKDGVAPRLIAGGLAAGVLGAGPSCIQVSLPQGSIEGPAFTLTT